MPSRPITFVSALSDRMRGMITLRVASSRNVAPSSTTGALALR